MKISLKSMVLALSLTMLAGGGLAGCASNNSDGDALVLPKDHKQMTAAEHAKMYPAGHDRSLGKRCVYDSETDSFYCNFPEGK